MKLRMIWLLLAAVFLICGCTGCENNPSSVDVTQERDIIDFSRWVAQEAYSLGQKTWGLLSITRFDESGNYFKVSVYAQVGSTRVIQTATLKYEDDDVLLYATIDNRAEVMRVKITRCHDEQLVLSLTPDSSDKMFFSFQSPSF